MMYAKRIYLISPDVHTIKKVDYTMVVLNLTYVCKRIQH